MKSPKNALRVTPHREVAVLLADEFRRGRSYDNWRPHGTADWLLLFTVGGAARIGNADAEILAAAGTATLYTPRTPQRYFTDPDTGHWHLLWSHFRLRPDWGAWLNWPEDCKGLRRIVLRSPTMIRHVRSALTDVIRFSRQKLPGGMDLAVNALERAILWLHAANRHGVLDERVRHAVDLLSERLREPFSLERLARECGLSVSRLAHLFREQVGVPPQQYVEDLRLQRAARLLRSTSLCIGEVAEETGYANAFYFSNRFRKMFRESPSRYRSAAGQSPGP